MTSEEEWRPVVGYEGYYEVSNHGRVRSVDRVVPHGHTGFVTLKGRVLRPNTHPAGHKMVCLTRENKAFQGKVHRLVLEAFVGPCPEGWEGCHWDGDPANNHLENLRWDTRSGNRQDAIRHGTLHNLGLWNKRRREAEKAAQATVQQDLSPEEGVE